MWQLLRTFPLMLAVLAVPIIPFMIWGQSIENEIHEYLGKEANPFIAGFCIVILLSSDVFLPIPSSVLSTVSGWRLGWLYGTLATWLGMNIGAILGYGFARQFGPGFSKWFCRDEDMMLMRDLLNRLGPTVLVLGRALPVFAEASILFAGIHQLTWRRFVFPVLASNLVIAIVYSTLGDLAAQYEWLTAAIVVSVCIPLLITSFARRMLPSLKEVPVQKDS